MLDTRSIEMFTNPQKLIDTVNPDLFNKKYSDWGSKSVNLIVTELLSEHISKVITNRDNFKKLLETYRKIGLKEGTQLMVMSYNAVICLYEVIDKTTLRVLLGAIHPKFGFTMVTSSDIQLFPYGEERDVWYRAENPIVNENYRRYKNNEIENMCRGHFSRSTALYIFLTLIEVETAIVQPKEKFHAKKYEGFKNMQRVPIAVADLSWSRETIVNVPFGVSGHLRNQRVGAGRMESKLIYIEPFIKSGYVKKSGKERILK